MHHPPSDTFTPKRTKAELITFINSHEYHQFVTLAFNGKPNAYGKQEPSKYHYDKLKIWDAMMNRAIWGRDWQAKHNPELMFAFWVMEKADTNPHWHGLIRFTALPEKSIKEQLEIFNANVDRKWQKLVPAGTADNKQVTDKASLVNYTCKSLQNHVNLNKIVLPDEFRSR